MKPSKSAWAWCLSSESVLAYKLRAADGSLDLPGVRARCGTADSSAARLQWSLCDLICQSVDSSSGAWASKDARDSKSVGCRMIVSPGCAQLLVQSTGERVVGQIRETAPSHDGAAFSWHRSGADTEPALPVHTKVPRELISVAIDDFLRDPNLLIPVSTRHP